MFNLLFTDQHKKSAVWHGNLVVKERNHYCIKCTSLDVWLKNIHKVHLHSCIANNYNILFAYINIILFYIQMMCVLVLANEGLFTQSL